RLAEQIARGIRREPAPSRPLTPSLRSVSLGNDFVRVPAESFSRRSRSSKSSRHASSRKHKKSSSDAPKKKSKKKKKSED
ncbi:MAG TPA: hypothetical protein VK581_09580, partial [Chthoniobacterales bacterium]|nr:hypothetical protein [Chthoniobacterales bacterium]